MRQEAEQDAEALLQEDADVFYGAVDDAKAAGREVILPLREEVVPLSGGLKSPIHRERRAQSWFSFRGVPRSVAGALGVVGQAGTSSLNLASDDSMLHQRSWRAGTFSSRALNTFLRRIEEDARITYYLDSDREEEEEEEEERGEVKAGGVGRAVLTFIKGMVGSYILYTPKLSHNGGMLFTAVALLLTALYSADNMLSLVACASKTGLHSYGQIAMAAFGPHGQTAVDISLVLSQMGFCVTYVIFVSTNLSQVLAIDADSLVYLQVLIYVPLSFIRKLKRMALMMVVANVCMGVGILLLISSSATRVIEGGEGVGEVELFVPENSIIVAGAVVTCFEGIGLVLPVRDSLPPEIHDQYPRVVLLVMVSLGLFFAGFSSLGYYAFGDDIKTFISMNLPSGGPASITTISLYSIMIIFSFPLQLFPAIKALERMLGLSGRKEHTGRTFCTTWIKNLLRILTVSLIAFIGLRARDSFDSFAGLIGGLCSAPLAIIYPPLFTLKLRRKDLSPGQRVWTSAALLTGGVGSLMVTYISIATWGRKEG